MGMTLALHPLAEPDIAQQLHGAIFEHAGADALEHVIPGLPLEHDAVDAIEMQHVGQQHAGRSTADDCDLRAFHLESPRGAAPP
jgi:hypothetical protein